MYHVRQQFQAPGQVRLSANLAKEYHLQTASADYQAGRVAVRPPQWVRGAHNTSGMYSQQFQTPGQVVRLNGNLVKEQAASPCLNNRTTSCEEMSAQPSQCRSDTLTILRGCSSLGQHSRISNRAYEAGNLAGAGASPKTAI